MQRRLVDEQEKEEAARCRWQWLVHCCRSGSLPNGWHSWTTDLSSVPDNHTTNSKIRDTNFSSQIPRKDMKTLNYVRFYTALAKISFRGKNPKILINDMLVLTLPSGSTSKRCLMSPSCRPLKTNWPVELGLSLTRKSPLCRSRFSHWNFEQNTTHIHQINC